MKTMRRKAARPAVRRPGTMLVCDVPVPARVADALGSDGADEAASRVALLELAGALAKRPDVQDTVLVDDLVELGLRVIQHSPASDDGFALRLLAACFIYLEHIGRLEARLRLVEQVRRRVDSLPEGSRHLVFRFLAIASLCADDPKQAWIDAEQAYDFASGLEASAVRFEILIIVVQTLDSMGLLKDALTLALQLADFPDGDPTLDTLHLVNATHGLSLSQRLDDVSAAGRFHDLARSKAASSLLPEVTSVVARFEAACAMHLVRVGRVRAAMRILNRAIARCAQAEDRRNEALLRCAQAEVHAATGIEAQMAESLVALRELLADLPSGCVMHPNLVRTIVKLLLRRNADGDHEVAMHYLHQLRDGSTLASGESWPALDLLSLRPVRDVQERFTSAGSPGRASGFDRAVSRPWSGAFDRLANTGTPWHGAGDDAPVLSRPELEASLRTRPYQIAEEWAIVAEIARGGDGRRCFKVGRVADAVAAALGFSVERCVLIDLGCRLRDIGHATLVHSHLDRHRLGTGHGEMQPAFITAHADTGARMLSFSSDPVLRLATRIARSHHACWNGSGYPAIGGEGIAVEARICAVADTLIDLVDPIDSRKPWPIELAHRQMQCMAGVQLDPALVEVLGRILNDEGSGTTEPALRWESPQANESFVQARKHLLEKLELAA